MFAIAIFLVTKAKDLHNHTLHFQSDNMPTVDAMSNMSSCSKQLMILLRIITITCLNNSIHYTIKHVKGSLNLHANHLSRLKLHCFMQQVDNIDALQYWSPWGQLWPLSKAKLNSY